MKQILIKNAHLVDPINQVDTLTDILISDKRIAKITRNIISITDTSTSIDDDGMTIIDAKERIVSPGIIDVQARFCEPGKEHITTIFDESQAAVKGGITTLLCPPDTTPVIDNQASAQLIVNRAKDSGITRLYPIGALIKQLDGQQLAEMNALKQAGCIALSNADIIIENTNILLKALKYAKSINLPVILRPIDSHLNIHGGIHDGFTAAITGLPPIPKEAELIALSKQLYLVKKSGVQAHFAQITCAESVDMIKQAKQQGLSISADVGLIHLFFTDEDINLLNTNLHCEPVLRTQTDQEALIKGLEDGTLDMISSDHRPLSNDEKCLPFVESGSGCSTIDCLLPMTCQLAHQRGWSISQLIEKLSTNPAKVFRLKYGNLAVGKIADLCIFDPQEEIDITPQHILSKGKNNPFIGMQARGKVHHTIKGGEVRYSAE